MTTIISTPISDIISKNVSAYRTTKENADRFAFSRQFTIEPSSLMDIAALTPRSKPVRIPEFIAADGRALLRVPSQYSTLQAAIDAASNWDTVLIANGTYSGGGFANLKGRGKHITIISEGGPLNCIMDGLGTYSHFINFDEFESSDNIIWGISATHFIGAAILLVNSSATIVNSVLTYNRNGIRAYVTESNPNTVVRCTNCVSAYNTTPNIGGGFALNRCSPTLTNCTIAYNHGQSVTLTGGGISCYDNANLVARNTIVYGNTGDAPGSIKDQQISVLQLSTADVQYCDVQVDTWDTLWPGTGNIKEDPGLDSQWKIPANSPCRDAGAPLNNTQFVTANDIYGNFRVGCGNPVDIGVFEFDGLLAPMSVRVHFWITYSGSVVLSPSLEISLREEAKTLFTPNVLDIVNLNAASETVMCVRTYFKPSTLITAQDNMFLPLGYDVEIIATSLNTYKRTSFLDIVLLSNSVYRLRVKNLDPSNSADVTIQAEWEETDIKSQYKVI